MKPRYLEVADDLRRQIADGTLEPGKAIPTSRELAALYGCSYGTIRGAMIILKTQGHLTGRQGKHVAVTQ